MLKCSFDDPLQTICINSIVNHFDRFCLAYQSPEAAIPKRNFEFLQRIYSADLTRKIDEQDKMKNEYLDLLINRHAKEFSLSSFYGCDWSVVEERLIDVGDTIAKLEMQNGPESLSHKSLEKIISHCLNLKNLNLMGSLCSDDTLTTIGKFCSSLKELDVSWCSRVTTKGLKNLFKINDDNVSSGLALQHLNVMNTAVDDKGIEFVLTHMPSLETIEYKDVPRVLYNMDKSDNNHDCFVGAKKYNLTTLVFFYDNSNSSVTEFLSACVNLCPKVKSLTITLSSEEDLKLCCKFTKLDTVHLIGKGELTNRNRFSINTFLEERGMELKDVELSYFTISVSVLLKNCPKLNKLILKYTDFENTGELNISPLNFLKWFRLEYAMFGEINTQKSTLSILNACPNLEVLQLPHSQSLTHEVSAAILRCMRSLKEIDLSFSDIELPFAESILVSSSSLESLNIEYCEQITALEYSVLLDMLPTLKNTVKLIWTDTASEYTYSDYDEDFFDEYDVYENSDYGYDAYDDFDGCDGHDDSDVYHYIDTEFEDV